MQTYLMKFLNFLDLKKDQYKTSYVFYEISDAKLCFQEYQLREILNFSLT